MPKTPVIIISGPPGAGKTTVSRLVAERFERSACLETDWFWTTILKGHIPPWLPDSRVQNRVIVESYSAAAAAMAVGGYSVVLDGSIGPWNLDLIETAIVPTGCRMHYFVLRPTRQIALQRGMSRVGEERVPGHPALTDEVGILHMWDEFSNLDEYESAVIDNSDAVPEHVASIILDRVRGDRDEK